MIKKVTVRRMLADYESKIKNQIKEVEAEITKMNNLCTTFEMKEIWLKSQMSAELHLKWKMLNNLKNDIANMRYSDMLADDTYGLK